MIRHGTMSSPVRAAKAGWRQVAALADPRDGEIDLARMDLYVANEFAHRMNRQVRLDDYDARRYSCC